MYLLFSVFYRGFQVKVSIIYSSVSISYESRPRKFTGTFPLVPTARPGSLSLGTINSARAGTARGE